MAAKFVTDAVHYAITLENGTKKHFPGGIMACSNRWNKNLCFDVDVCWLLCTPGQVQPRSHLAYLIYTSGSTGTPKEQRLGFFQTNIVPKWEYFCVVTDMITTISHIQFCLDRWKQECPASTITARSFSVTEQCLQCASRLWKLIASIFEACFARQHSYCGDALSVKTSTHLRGTEWGGASLWR